MATNVPPAAAIPNVALDNSAAQVEHANLAATQMLGAQVPLLSATPPAIPASAVSATPTAHHPPLSAKMESALPAAPRTRSARWELTVIPLLETVPWDALATADVPQRPLFASRPLRLACNVAATLNVVETSPSALEMSVPDAQVMPNVEAEKSARVGPVPLDAPTTLTAVLLRASAILSLDSVFNV